MKRIARRLSDCGALVLGSVQAQAQHAGSHVMLDPSQLVWNDLPALPGVKIAVIEGPLTEAVPIMFRLEVPGELQGPAALASGHRAHHHHLRHPEHRHGRDVRHGEDACADPRAASSIMPPGTPHFVWTSEETIGQVHSIGPWSVNYVNPADDPRRK